MKIILIKENTNTELVEEKRISPYRLCKILLEISNKNYVSITTFKDFIQIHIRNYQNFNELLYFRIYKN